MAKRPAPRQSIRPAVTPGVNPPHIVRAELHARSGPLPSPGDLARYEQYLPGAADRIVTMAETQQQHQISLDRQAQASDIEHRNAVLAAQVANARREFRSNLVGQLFGGLVALGCTAGAIYALTLGSPWYVIAIFLGLPVAAIIKALHSRNRQEEPPHRP